MPYIGNTSINEKAAYAESLITARIVEHVLSSRVLTYDGTPLVSTEELPESSSSSIFIGAPILPKTLL